jgi:hypothetical protein
MVLYAPKKKNKTKTIIDVIDVYLVSFPTHIKRNKVMDL